MRKISIMNYVIVAIIFVITIVSVLALRKLYLDRKADEPTNKRLEILSEIKEADLKSYLVENTETVIYLSHAKDESLKDFEELFNNYIKEHELSKEIVYLNLDTVSSKFYDNIQEKYLANNLSNLKLLDQENIFLIQNGKITKVLNENEKTLTINSVEEFLKANEVIE